MIYMAWLPLNFLRKNRMADVTDYPTKPMKKKETLGEMIRSVIFMVLLALLFRSVAYEPFHIPSGSMLSTLYEGDYIFVSKFSYGYSRFSFPFSPKLFDGRILESAPKRGDVIVFRNPAQPKVDYIKRLIGMPGDTVQMKRGRLYINGEMVEQTRRGEVLLPDDCGTMRPLARYEEVLPGGARHTVLDDLDVSEISDVNRPITCPATRSAMVQRQTFDPDNSEIYTVPEGHYFMMGDNRDHSQDSRFSYENGFADAPGFVPFSYFVGRAEIIAFS